jgi:hypothetical protein
MEDQKSIDPVAALPYETPGDPPANVVVLIRLAILVLAAVAVQYFLAGMAILFTYLSMSPSARGFGFVFFCSTLGTAGGWLGLSWYLWKKAPELALRLFGRNVMQSAAGTVAGNGTTDFVAVGIVVLGLFEIIEAIYSVSDVLTPMLVGNMYQRYTPNRGWILLIPAVIRAELGIWLVLGTHWILDLIRKFSDRYGFKSASAPD